jgi:hypothetical protein
MTLYDFLAQHPWKAMVFLVVVGCFVLMAVDVFRKD